MATSNPTCKLISNWFVLYLSRAWLAPGAAVWCTTSFSGLSSGANPRAVVAREGVEALDEVPLEEDEGLLEPEALDFEELLPDLDEPDCPDEEEPRRFGSGAPPSRSTEHCCCAETTIPPTSGTDRGL